MHLTYAISIFGLLASVSSLEDRGNWRLREAASYVSNADVTAESTLQLLKRDTYIETATELVKSAASGVVFRLVDDHYIGSNGIGHVHFKQTVHGLDVDNADFTVNIARDGSVFSFSNSFYQGEVPDEIVLEESGIEDPIRALDIVCDTLQLVIGRDTAEVEIEAEAYTIKGTSGTLENPKAEMVYFVQPDGTLALTWRVETEFVDKWLVSYVLEAESRVLGVVDRVSHATYEV
jgi:extracellular elastinolytic metalloproteinase